MMRASVIALVVALGLGAPAARAESAPPGFAAKLQQVVTRDGAPGVTALVMKNGRLLYRLDEGAIAPDPAEVDEWKWMTLPAIAADLRKRPEDYAPWFRHYIAAHENDLAAWLKQTAAETIGGR